MTATISATSPHFERAAAHAMGVLATAMAQLRGLEDDAQEVSDKHEVMGLYTVALLSHHQGRHIVEDIPDEYDIEEISPSDLPDLLIDAHPRLVEHTSALDPFFVLEFDNEIGILCRGVKRYVERHRPAAPHVPPRTARETREQLSDGHQMRHLIIRE